MRPKNSPARDDLIAHPRNMIALFPRASAVGCSELLRKSAEPTFKCGFTAVKNHFRCIIATDTSAPPTGRQEGSVRIPSKRHHLFASLWRDMTTRTTYGREIRNSDGDSFESASQGKCTRALIMSATHKCRQREALTFDTAQRGPPVNPRVYIACLWNIFIHVNIWIQRNILVVVLDIFDRLSEVHA